MSAARAALSCETPDWRALCEAERVRTDAAEARMRELRCAEMDACARAGTFQAHLDRARGPLQTARSEVKSVRREAKQALSYQAQVARLEALLAEAGVEPSWRATMVSLRQDIFRPKRKLEEARGHEEKAEALGRKVKSLERTNAGLKAGVAKLRGTGAKHAKAHFGSKGEKHRKAHAGNQRGQREGKSGPGRTPLPKLEKKAERHDPPASQRTCPCCGEPW